MLALEDHDSLLNKLIISGRRGRRRKKLLDDLKDRTGYCQMKEEALDRIVWRNRLGRSFGPIVWQTTTDDDDDDDDETKVLYYYRHIKANKPKTAQNWTRIPAATFFSITVLRAKLPWFSSYSLICFHNLNRLITACHGRLLHMNWILSMRIFWRLAHPVLYSSGLKRRRTLSSLHNNRNFDS